MKQLRKQHIISVWNGRANSFNHLPTNAVRMAELAIDALGGSVLVTIYY